MSAITPDLTVRQVAEITQLSEESVRCLCATGRLRAYRAGRLWRVPAEALDEFRAGEGGEPPGDRTPRLSGQALRQHEEAMAWLRAEGVIK
jgi:excisionase family DNA binding protein